MRVGPGSPPGEAQVTPKRSAMQSRWKDADARKAVETWARPAWARTLALRTYTTRLLGRDPALVLHGGGNTSLKTRMTDLLGETREVLCVKASGRDMAEIDPAASRPSTSRRCASCARSTT